MNQISSWKCKTHSKHDISYGCMNESCGQIFICQVCLLKDKNHLADYVSIPEIQSQEDDLPIQNWPQGIEQKYLDYLNDHSTTNKYQKMHDKILHFYKNLESILFDTIQKQKENAISQLYSFEQCKNDLMGFYNEKFKRKQLQETFFESGESGVEVKFKDLLQELQKTKEKDLEQLYKRIDEYDSFDSHVSFDQPKEIQLVIEQLLSKINMYSSELIKDVENTTDFTFDEDNIDISQIGKLFMSGLTKFSNLKQQLAKNLKELKEHSEMAEKKVLVSITDLQNNSMKEREKDEISKKLIGYQESDFLHSISSLEKSIQTLNKQGEESDANQKSFSTQFDALLKLVKNIQINQQTIEESITKVNNSQSLSEDNNKMQNELTVKMESLCERMEEIVKNQEEKSDQDNNNSDDDDDDDDHHNNNNYYNNNNTVSRRYVSSENTNYYSSNQNSNNQRECRFYEKREYRERRKYNNNNNNDDMLDNLELTIDNYNNEDDDCEISRDYDNNIKIELKDSGFTALTTPFINRNLCYIMRVKFSTCFGKYRLLQIGITAQNSRIFIKKQQRNLLINKFNNKYMKNIKGNFHKYLDRNEIKEIEMRVCVSSGDIQFADYPNYDHVVGNRHSISQNKRYKIAISVYGYDMQDIFITHYESQDEFNSF